MSRLDAYIRETPAAVQRLLDVPTDFSPLKTAFSARAWRKIWIVGSGTSLFASKIAADVWEEALVIDTEAMGALIFREQVTRLRLGPDTIVIGISQTGATNVLVEAIKIAQARGALTIACTAFPEAPLAQASDYVLDSQTGPENTPGKTKGFTTTTVAVCQLALELAQGELGWRKPAEALVARLHDAMATTEGLVERWAYRLSAVQAIWVVGSGAMATAAVEGGLKMLEVAKLPVIGKELEEMMHGQFHAIGEGCAVVFLAGDIERVGRIADLRRVVEAVGVPLIAIADRAVADTCPEWPWDLVLNLTDVGPLAPLVGALPLQLLAERLARARGLEPDQPRYPELYRISGSKSIYARPVGK